MQVRIQALSSIHKLKNFDCGAKPLNTWLATMATQQERRYLAKTFVCVDCNVPDEVLGFYSLAVSEISNDTLPNRNKYPKRVPVIRLGRFATDLRWQRQGIGETLLFNALERIADIAENTGSAAVVVDAKDATAAAYYAKFGFIPSPENPLQLFMPMQILLASLRQP